MGKKNKGDKDVLVEEGPPPPPYNEAIGPNTIIIYESSDVTSYKDSPQQVL